MDRGVEMPKINQEEYEALKGLDNRWKWIARDDENQIYSAELYVFERKPEQEDGYWNNISNGEYALLEERDDLFQFIRWEDEEPYEIDELIREYEIKELRLAPLGTVIVDSFDESEKTEVKKQELIKNIKSLAREASQQWPHEEMVELPDVLREIDQLDEPEVLSAEWIEGNTSPVDDEGRLYIWKRDLENLLVPKQEITFDQVRDKLREESILSEKSFDYYWNCINDNVEIDEPGNLIVPKQEELETKILELIESYKQEEDAYSNPENGWISGFIEDLKNLVEKEPMYYALIKGHELTDSYDIYWNVDRSDYGVFVSRLHPLNDNFITEMSKEAWNELGINETNADLIEVDW